MRNVYSDEERGETDVFAGYESLSTKFSRLVRSRKMHLLALWAFLQTEMTDFRLFPTLSYT